MTYPVHITHVVFVISWAAPRITVGQSIAPEIAAVLARRFTNKIDQEKEPHMHTSVVDAIFRAEPPNFDDLPILFETNPDPTDPAKVLLKLPHSAFGTHAYRFL